jgi:putative endonuclease
MNVYSLCPEKSCQKLHLCWFYKQLYYHNSGYNKSTNPYRPFKLIYSEEVTNSTDARIREKFLKSGQGRKFLKTIMHYE